MDTQPDHITPLLHMRAQGNNWANIYGQLIIIQLTWGEWAHISVIDVIS